MGVVLYFVFRAGLLTANAAATDTNPFGVLAIAALSGMFSKQATDKLDEVFKTLFRTESDPRGDKLVHPVPAITRIEPPSVPAGATGVVLTISGEGFSEDSVVRLDAQERSMEYESSTRISVPLAAEDTASARTFEVTVYNPDPGGGVSMLWPFTVAGTDGSSAPPDDPGG
ncbi:MAG: IPT/TIG domain-containing protein [Dehalococcoidia bacterium]